MKFAIALAAALLGAPAFAAVELKTDVFVETMVPAKDGKLVRKLEPAKVVTPGASLIYVNSYVNATPKAVADFTINNPLPGGVEFVSDESGGADVSVDGGNAFGRLGTLSVVNPDGTKRPARSSDVTHVRWKLASAIPAGKGGEVSFKARVK